MDPDFDQASKPPRTYRLYEPMMVALVTVTLCSNLISSSKLGQFGGYAFGAGVMFFPFSYIVGDLLTEVYGYRQARKAIWAAFGAQTFAAFMAMVVVAIPPAEGWAHQSAWELVFGSTWRIVAASLTAFLLGEWVNSVVLAKLKVQTGGRLLFLRTIGSTVVGQGVDSLVFYPLAFAGIWSDQKVLEVMVTNYLLKVAVEVLATPLTYVVVARVKRVEGIDVYDKDTNFSINPTAD